MKWNHSLLVVCSLGALAFCEGCIPSGPTPPSGAVSSDGGGTSMPEDMATTVVRKCKDFDSFGGVELACWDFTDEAARNLVADWAINQDIVTKACWGSSSTTPTVLQAGGNISLPAKAECSLALTGTSSISGKGIDLGGSSAVTVAMNFQVAGFSTPTTALAFTVKPGLLPEMPVGNIGGNPKDFFSYAMGFPVPADQSANFQSSDLRLTFTRSLAEQQLFVRSIAVLGTPRR